MIVILRSRDALFGRLVLRTRVSGWSCFRDTGGDSELIETGFLLCPGDCPLWWLRGLFQTLAAAEMFAAGIISLAIKKAMILSNLVLSLHLWLQAHLPFASRTGSYSSSGSSISTAQSSSRGFATFGTLLTGLGGVESIENQSMSSNC